MIVFEIFFITISLQTHALIGNISKFKIPDSGSHNPKHSQYPICVKYDYLNKILTISDETLIILPIITMHKNKSEYQRKGRSPTAPYKYPHRTVN